MNITTDSIDSAKQILDSLKQSNLKLHIIDSIKTALQTINPEKTSLEKYSILITGFFAILALGITIYANRKQMQKDNMIKFRKVWLDETSKLISEIYELMSVLNSRVGSLMSIDEYNAWFLRAMSLKVLLNLKYSVDGKSLKFLSNYVNEVLSSYNPQVVYVDENVIRYRLGIKKNPDAIHESEFIQVTTENLVPINKFSEEADKFIESEMKKIFE